jgi:hypothetical protein
VLTAPILSTTAGSGSVALSWTAVPGALFYKILRNDSGCDTASTRLPSLITAVSFNDTGLANGFTVYYNVQAFVSNSMCDGPLSNCQAVTPQSPAGTVGLDAGVYSCSSTITVTVVDSNIGSNTTAVSLASTTEPAAEPVTLTRVSPGSATYQGTIATTSGAPLPTDSFRWPTATRSRRRTSMAATGPGRQRAALDRGPLHARCRRQTGRRRIVRNGDGDRAPARAPPST